MQILRKTAFLIALVLTGVADSGAELNRGVWFWGNTNVPSATPGAPDVPSDYGSIPVVGVGTKEDETTNFFTTHGVKRVYGSYQNRPVSHPGVIADWNTKLDAAGIQSQLLVDGNAVNDPAWMAGLLVKIDNRLINFNNALGGDEASKFKALHLDLEPQGLALWDDHLDKRALLDDLLIAYQDIRAHLDSAGFTAMPIYADIPFFYDKMWNGTEGVGWAGLADRDAWYASVGAVIDGISIMTFSKGSFAAIDAATSYERAGAMLGKARVGIQPKTGPGNIWPTYTHFHGVMNQLESNYGTEGATDIENYGFWRHYITPVVVGPFIATPIEAELVQVDNGGVVIFHGVPGFIYMIKSSTDLDEWGDLEEVNTMESSRDAEFRVPVATNARRGFFKVVRSDPEEAR